MTTVIGVICQVNSQNVIYFLFKSVLKNNSIIIFYSKGIMAS